MMGGLLHVDTFAHNKSDIAYQIKSRRPETVANYKRNPSSSRGCNQTVPIKHFLSYQLPSMSLTEPACWSCSIWLRLEVRQKET
jgi:hypothetical protein